MQICHSLRKNNNQSRRSVLLHFLQNIRSFWVYRKNSGKLNQRKKLTKKKVSRKVVMVHPCQLHRWAQSPSKARHQTSSSQIKHNSDISRRSYQNIRSDFDRFSKQLRHTYWKEIDSSHLPFPITCWILTTLSWSTSRSRIQKRYLDNGNDNSVSRSNSVPRRMLQGWMFKSSLVNYSIQHSQIPTKLLLIISSSRLIHAQQRIKK